MLLRASNSSDWEQLIFNFWCKVLIIGNLVLTQVIIFTKYRQDVLVGSELLSKKPTLNIISYCTHLSTYIRRSRETDRTMHVNTQTHLHVRAPKCIYYVQVYNHPHSLWRGACYLRMCVWCLCKSVLFSKYLFLAGCKILTMCQAVILWLFLVIFFSNISNFSALVCACVFVYIHRTYIQT